MSVIVYPALVAASSDTLEARFVDLPEVSVTAGSQADLIRLARERLSVELQRLVRSEAPWPEPTALGRVVAPSGASVLLIDVSVDDTPIRLTISLGERLLKRIDQDAEARSMTRSGYLALGARRLLGEAGEPGGRFSEDAGRKLQEEMAVLGRRMNEVIGPESPVGRTLAELDAMALDGLRRLGGEVRSALKAGASRHPDPPTSAKAEEGPRNVEP